MSDQRVNQTDARGDAARLLHAAARERLKVVMTDLFLPTHLRLSEWQRTVMNALLDRLVQSIEEELRGGLVRSIAAALRTYLVERHGVSPDEADDALAAVANRSLSTNDEGEGLEARCLKLASVLDERGRLDGAFLVRALIEGGLSLLLAALSLRCALLPDAVWELVSEPLGRGVPLLLRAAGLDRTE